MEREAFKNFCHDEIIKRGFKKRKNYYYFISEEVLCLIYVQKSISNAYYVNYDYFIGRYNDPKQFPRDYCNGDLGKRLVVWSKDTYKGEHFWDACIEYEAYTQEELIPYFERAFDEFIMPPLLEGKKRLLPLVDEPGAIGFQKDKEEIRQKLLSD